MSKRVWKLQDFVAHSGRAHCARLGEKSGQVLATGGEDKRVNIWKVGKPQAMMSLTGHQSAVECLVFDKQEEVLVVGCGGGSLQVWNLEYRKMAGTLAGHRTACEAVEFHPYGEFFASGSADTNLKIWDLRRKSCIQTYKGHASAITSIRFSPHGRWVATGGQDNVVKLWDLTAGKLMRDLDLHRGPITTIAFHPKEYLLATGSADRTAKLWSLESFQSVGSTDMCSSPIQVVKFHSEEPSVICASQDSLRLYPTDCLTTPSDSVEVDWRGLQDMRLCCPEDKLIAISAEGSQLGVWVADLQRRETFAANRNVVGSRAGSGTPGATTPPSFVRSLMGGRAGNPQAAGDVVAPTPTSAPHAEHSENSCGPHRSERPAADADDAGNTSAEPRALPRQELPTACTPAVAGVGPVPSRLPLEPARGSQSPGACRSPARQAPAPAGASPSKYFLGGGTGAEAAGAAPSPAVLSPSPPDRPPCAAPQVVGGTSTAAVSSRSPPRGRSGSTADAMTADFIWQLAQPHQQMKSVLTRRLDQVRRLKELWVRGSLTNLGTVLQMPQDHAVFCDFMRAVMRGKLEATLNLDACQILLPIVTELMSSKYDDFALASLQFAEVLLENFGGVILDTRRSSGQLERQPDLAREERCRKCEICYEHFKEIQRLLQDNRMAIRFGAFRQALQSFLQAS